MPNSSVVFSPAANKAEETDTPKKEAVVNELQIVEAFSRVSVPESVLKNSNVSQLVAEMNLAKTTLDSAEAKLSALRQQKKESNFLSNMWNDQDDKIEDAQVALDKNVRWLSSLSSKLLILNTAMAKIMHGQQGVLQHQQLALTDQARGIEEQNVQIKAQQEILERNQREFNKAVEALAKATELTHTQAGELMRCLEKVAASEKRMLTSYEELAATLNERLHAIADDWSKVLANKLADLSDAQRTLDQQVDERLTTSAASAAEQLIASEQRVLASHEELTNAVDKRLQSTVQAWSTTVAKQEAAFNQAHLALDRRVEERLMASDASTLGKFSTFEGLLLELDTKLSSIAAREATIVEDVERQRKALRMYRVAHVLGGLAIAALFLWTVIARSALSH